MSPYKIYVLATIGAIVCCLAVILGPFPFGALLIAVPVLIAGVILLPVFIYAAWQEQRVAEGLRKPDGSWAHWMYGPHDGPKWELFAKAESNRAKRKALFLTLELFAFSILFVVVAAARSPKGLDLTLLKVGTGMIMASVLCGGVIYLSGQFRYNLRHSGPYDVYIGPEGIWHDRVYTPLRGPMLSLSVALENSVPPVLCFQILDSGVRGGSTREVRLPVPSGHETEAAELVARFQHQH